ncbi:MAG: hypothetical protein RIR09_519 [Pseudomonadota bacterium]
MNAARSVTATFGVGRVVAPISQINLSGVEASEQYFSVAVPAGSTNLIVQTSGGTGDVDLYVKSLVQPTTSDYDCRPFFIGNSETCTFLTPTATTYHIMLYGYEAYNNVNLTVSYTLPKVDLTPILMLLLD